MKVRFFTSVAGANFAYRPKKEYDLPAAIASQFVRSGQAEAVEPEPEDRPKRRRGGKLAETATRVADSLRF